MIQRFRSTTPEQKKEYNEELFKVVAPKYDLIKNALSFHRDAAWKRHLVARIPDGRYRVCVDIACGTGDLALAVAKRFPQAVVHGIDLSPEMIELARARSDNPDVQFSVGNMQELPFQAETVDVLTGGYALRNAPDLRSALLEIHRVLKPDGLAAFLDFSKTPSCVGQFIGYRLLLRWGQLWGLLMHGNPAVYGYLADSLQHYPDRDALHALLAEEGLGVIEARRFMGGMIEVTMCRKRA